MLILTHTHTHRPTPTHVSWKKQKTGLQWTTYNGREYWGQSIKY